MNFNEIFYQNLSKVVVLCTS